jgi:hypothetical protein
MLNATGAVNCRFQNAEPGSYKSRHEQASAMPNAEHDGKELRQTGWERPKSMVSTALAQSVDGEATKSR